jgi:hypothetical protein
VASLLGRRNRSHFWDDLEYWLQGDYGIGDITWIPHLDVTITSVYFFLLKYLAVTNVDLDI